MCGRALQPCWQCEERLAGWPLRALLTHPRPAAPARPLPPTEWFFSFTSFVEPGAIYRVDAAAADPAPALFRRIATAGFSPDDFVTKQVGQG